MPPFSFDSIDQESLPEGVLLVRTLGRTAFSEVLLVEKDGVPCALKLLHGVAAHDPRILERWHREARLLNTIEHDNLVRSYGTLDVNGHPALLLEFIDGPTLRELLTESPLGWEQAVRYGVQVARALERLHRNQAIHRDVKPHNILIHPTRGAVLADLGLVRMDDDATLTRQPVALGSPAYMSPEQARDPSEVGPEADVYSLAATLYHALSGRPPFLGKGVGEVIHRVLHEEPPPLPEEVPLPIRQVLACALSKDPESRYARAGDFALDLGRVLLGDKPLLLHRRRRRRRMRIFLALSGGVAFVGAIGWWAIFRGSALDEPPALEMPDVPVSSSAPIEEQFLDLDAASVLADRFQQLMVKDDFGKARLILHEMSKLEILTEELDWVEQRDQWVAENTLILDAAQARCFQAAILQMSESLNVALANSPCALPDEWEASVLAMWKKEGILIGEWETVNGRYPLQEALLKKKKLLRERKRAEELAAARAVPGGLAQNESAVLAPEPTELPVEDEPEIVGTVEPKVPEGDGERETEPVFSPEEQAQILFVNGLRAEFPRAEVEWVENSIQFVFKGSAMKTDWAKEWRMKAPPALSDWRLSGWAFEWKNPLGYYSLPRVTWLDDVYISGTTQFSGGLVEVGRSGSYRFTLVEGATHRLEWSGGELKLDGLAFASWHPSRRVLSGRIKGKAEDGFTPLRVVLNWAKK